MTEDGLGPGRVSKRSWIQLRTFGHCSSSSSAFIISIILHTHAFETCIRIHTFLKRTTNALTSLLFEKHLSPHLALRDGGNH